MQTCVSSVEQTWVNCFERVGWDGRLLTCVCSTVCTYLVHHSGTEGVKNRTSSVKLVRFLILFIIALSALMIICLQSYITIGHVCK